MTDTKRYGLRPDPESLMGRIFTWLEANPTETLSFEDVATRFEVSHMQARTALMHLRERGLAMTGPCVWLNPERVRE